jgi:magnesium transporter
MAVRAVFFDAEGQDREVQLDAKVVESLTERQLLWVDIVGQAPTLIKQVASLFGLNQETVAGLIETHARPQLQNYGEYLHLRVLGVTSESRGAIEPAIEPADRLNSGPIDAYVPVHLDLVAGPNYVITVQAENTRLFEQFVRQVRGNTRIGQLTAPAFLASILDLYLESYFVAIERIENEIDLFDEQALQARSPDRDLLPTLVSIRRSVSGLRRLLLPHRVIFARLSRPDFETNFGEAESAGLEDLSERLKQAIEAVENARESVIGSFGVLTTQTAQFTNDIVRVLTVVTVAIGVVGVMAAIFGMSFQDVAFLKTGTTGYLVAVAGMAVVALGIVLVARYRRWI